MGSVLKLWVQEIPWKMQSILQGGFRGPDDRSTPAIKSVNRWLRYISQYSADASKEYMKKALLPTDYELCAELEYCTCHYTHHLADAIRVVHVYHPYAIVREQAWKFHMRIAEELFHFIPESDEVFMLRHKDISDHEPQEREDRSVRRARLV